MAEETMTQKAAAPAAPTGTPSNGAASSHQTERLVPSFRLEQEISAKREAVQAQESAVKQIADLTSKLEQAAQALVAKDHNHSQELHLISQGFKAPSVRRFFKREYNDAVSELPQDKRPGFDQWLEANREDPLYSVHFQRNSQEVPQPETPTETAPADNTHLLSALQAALSGNPNAGAGQPSDNRAKEWTVEEIRKLRGRNNGSMGKHRDEIMAQWRAKGLIK